MSIIKNIYMAMYKYIIILSTKNCLQFDLKQFTAPEAGVANILNMIYLPTIVEHIVIKQN